MKTYLFVNPGSGRHNGQRIAGIIERLAALGHPPHLYEVRSPDDIMPRCAEINRDQRGQRLVVIAAGDGTINAVVNGLDPGTATLAVLPMGTSNVLAAEIGISSISDGLEKIAAGQTRSLSLGVITCQGGPRRFVLMAGIGLDGAVVRDVLPNAKRLLRQGGYALSALGNVLRWDHGTFEVTTASERVVCHSVIICNAARYGGDFVLAAGNSLFSPGLTALCIPSTTRMSYLRLAYGLFTGTLAATDLIRLPATGMNIGGNKPIQLDGDFIGYGPASISQLADFAQIIV